MSKQLLLISLIPLIIMSCSGKPTVQDFLDDPELLSKTTNQCITQVFGDEVHDKETCAIAKEAQIQKAKNAINSIFE
ncbi:MAG: hypothetical protein HRU38_06720 [Saccharospirillaceae bacterium]|nr:hypothetical protein [Pseudomonadales bacterium]NRB78347.1 hypothetical protein [Saccharospirillaceae bacterium]